jgi:hypothetical protein
MIELNILAIKRILNGKPKITDKYLFSKKNICKKNKSFAGVKSPSALWKKVYYATGDYDETKKEN